MKEAKTTLIRPDSILDYPAYETRRRYILDKQQMKLEENKCSWVLKLFWKVFPSRKPDFTCFKEVMPGTSEYETAEYSEVVLRYRHPFKLIDI